MDPQSPSPAPKAGRKPRPEPRRQPEADAADAVMSAYVGYLAGWFDIAQLAAGRRLVRGGVRSALLNDL